MGKKILVVEDDSTFVRLVGQVLTSKGYEILEAGSGQEALRLLFDQRPDLVLLDVILPGMDGWKTCSRIRDICNIPVIMLSGHRSAEEDIVHGLDCGADDYLVKPVGNRELVARVRAVLRRAELLPSQGKMGKTNYSDNLFTVDVVEHKVTVDGERVRLTPIEFRLLTLLVENAGYILTHKQLLERVWGWEYIDDLDHVRAYIWHLRQKIEIDPPRPRYIMTEPGVGYYFRKSD